MRTKTVSAPKRRKPPNPNAKPKCVVCLRRPIDAYLLCTECHADRWKRVPKADHKGDPDLCEIVIWCARRVRQCDKEAR